MIKAILIDDEAHVRQDIREKLDHHFSKEIVIMDEAESVAKALDAIKTHEPHLLFLDIHLPDGNGFDLIAQSDFKKFEVIFITGYDNHAIKAIKVGALDYILKPIDDGEFKAAVIKAIENHKKENHLEKLIEISSEYFQGVKKRRIILKTTNNVYAIYEDDIIYCKSDGNYTTLYSQLSGKIVASKSLKKITEILSEDVFVRCHQSYIVNKKYVLKYNKQGVLIVKPDIRVPVSGRRKDYVIKRIFE
ncbi:LytR/AlgR family response regulator transcription factor [Winogradskyella sp.]|uniref:LytR/AlgR family response regulator transcription factor n=1 Tax=Winogradskyella sp. TaxID=1883156 RepID=UPI003BA9E87F